MRVVIIGGIGGLGLELRDSEQLACSRDVVGADMPAYAETVMSEKDLADIYAFLQALRGRRDVKDFTILND